MQGLKIEILNGITRRKELLTMPEVARFYWRGDSSRERIRQIEADNDISPKVKERYEKALIAAIDSRQAVLAELLESFSRKNLITK